MQRVVVAVLLLVCTSCSLTKPPPPGPPTPFTPGEIKAIQAVTTGAELMCPLFLTGTVRADAVTFLTYAEAQWPTQSTSIVAQINGTQTGDTGVLGQIWYAIHLGTQLLKNISATVYSAFFKAAIDGCATGLQVPIPNV